mmetsp:Transcript_66146/g.129650  ORF Transcript_66146/g.129650 Transcript_66146/m.129650 type:complete len:236 (-) Transcript_66146:123-830(-)
MRTLQWAVYLFIGTIPPLVSPLLVRSTLPSRKRALLFQTSVLQASADHCHPSLTSRKRFLESARRLAASSVVVGIAGTPGTSRAETNDPVSASESVAPASEEAVFVTSDSGLQYVDLVVGQGAFPSPGQSVKVHYTGWLNGFDAPGMPPSKYCGETLQVPPCKFDSSYARRTPLSFSVGAGKVIKGWDEGLLSMRPGGKRRLVVPPNLAYGKRGAGAIIPPNAVLFFEVELLAVN